MNLYPPSSNIYGHCAQAFLNDYPTGPSLQDIFDDNQGEYPSYNQLFQIAHDVASAVVDVHHYNENGNATMVHMNIQPNQWIYMNDRFVLNDFSSVEFLTRNNETNKTCGTFKDNGNGRVSTEGMIE